MLWLARVRLKIASVSPLKKRVALKRTIVVVKSAKKRLARKKNAVRLKKRVVPKKLHLQRKRNVLRRLKLQQRAKNSCLQASVTLARVKFVSLLAALVSPHALSAANAQKATVPAQLATTVVQKATALAQPATPVQPATPAQRARTPVPQEPVHAQPARVRLQAWRQSATSHQRRQAKLMVVVPAPVHRSPVQPLKQNSRTHVVRPALSQNVRPVRAMMVLRVAA